jgi:hypothetical protein
MNRASYSHKIIVSIYQECHISSLIKVPHPSVPAVEETSVADVEMTHELRKIALNGLYQGMKMVGHAYISFLCCFLLSSFWNIDPSAFYYFLPATFFIWYLCTYRF